MAAWRPFAIYPGSCGKQCRTGDAGAVGGHGSGVVLNGDQTRAAEFRFPLKLVMQRTKVNLAGLLAVAAFVLTACETTESDLESDLTPEFVRSRTQVNHDAETGMQWVVSPPYFWRGRYGPQASLIAKWRSGEPPVFQLYFYHALNARAFYEMAADENGKPLEVEFLGRKVGGEGVYEERIAAILKREALESAGEEGLAVTFLGRNNRERVWLPGFFVEGFLEKADLIYLDREGPPEPDTAAR